MKEIAAAGDSPIWTGYEVCGRSGEHGDACGDYRIARMDHRMVSASGKKTAEMAAETADEMMLTWEGGASCGTVSIARQEAH